MLEQMYLTSIVQSWELWALGAVKSGAHNEKSDVRGRSKGGAQEE